MKSLFRTLFAATFILTLLLSALLPNPQAATAAAPGPGEGAVVRVYFPDKAALDELPRTTDIWEVNHAAGYLVTWASPLRQADLTAAGYTVEVDAEYTARITAPRVVPEDQVNGIPGFACYRTVEETQATLTSLNTTYPNLVLVNDIGNSWDKQTGGGPSGYDILLLRLTNEDFTPAGGKFRFFLMAEAHAREYVTTETATRLAEYLLSSYGTDPDITWLLDYGEIHIVAMTNPDGRKFAEQGELWRKNTNNTNGCTSFPDYGTDLNRNASFKWGDAGTNPCEETYQGPFANSEPETQAIQTYVAGILEDRRGPADTDATPADYQGLFITLHSYSGLVLWPWGWTGTAAPNDTGLQTLGRKLAYFNNYSPQQSVELYATTGSHDDWAYGILGVPAYTFEMGNDFFEPCSGYESIIWPDNRDALLWAFKTARRPYMTPAGPDVTAAAVSPANVLPGAIITLTGSVTDTRYYDDDGTEPTQNIQAARYSIDTPSWITGATTYAMAAADGSFNAKTENVTAAVDTTGLTPGRHTLFIEGQDLSGNWGVPTAVFFNISSPSTGYALLSPAQSEATANPGGTAVHTFTLTNAGLASDTFALSVSNTPTWTTTIDPASVILGAGEEAEITVSVVVPAGAPGGATDTADITATPSDPAYASTAQALTFLSQVTMTPDTAAGSALPGATATYTLTITNNSDGWRTFDVLVESSDWVTTVAPALVGMYPGNSKTVTVTVTVPAGAALGDFDEAVILTQMRSDTRHTDRSTLTTTAAEATRGVDLTTADAAEAALPGQSAAYTLTLTNTGNAVDSFDLTATGNTWPGVTISPATVTNLAAGGTASITVTVPVPADAGGTSDVVTITAVSQADAAATDSLDLTTTAAEATRGVDLTTADAAEEALPGQSATYTLTLTNTGDAADSFDLTASGNTWPGVIISPATVTNLAAGGTASITVTVPVPADAGGASDVVTITAVSQADAAATDSLDLTTTALEPAYGVALTTDTPAQSILPGGTAVYTVTLTNTGGGTDSFDLTTTGSAWAGITVQPATVSNLASGGTATITVTVPAPAGLSGAADTVTLRAVSQGDDTVADTLDLTTTIGWLIHLPLVLK